MSSTDPLSFFAGEDSSDSESEGEENQEDTKIDSKLNEKEADSNELSSKLPSPDTLFATVGRPAFLDTAPDRHINWDRFVKKHEDNIHETDSHIAIPPPADLDSGNRSKPVSSGLSIAIASTYSEPSAEISAKPVKYTSQDVEPKFRTVSDSNQSEITATAKVGSKRPVQEIETGSSSKKAKGVETFRQKEKRKRNLGQTSREKNYVEEEKRILRQAFSTDEIMS